MEMNNDRCTYLLPIRRRTFSAEEAAEFARYFSGLTNAGCDVLVINGSPPEVFERHHDVWKAHAQHGRVDRRFGFLNDKVNGIHTGVELSPNEKIILADDDIRYNASDLEQMASLLENYEVVRPQNFLGERVPWWARLEAARMLINRATLRMADYPGTCAFRRATMLRLGHYDGDVLFDNEEMIRHFACHRARICYATDCFIEKRPPSFRKWVEQRPRQAYEDFALRAKTMLFFSLPIIALFLVLALGFKTLMVFCLTSGALSTMIALVGWARGSAVRYFPASTIFFAPLWILERSLSTYWALYWYLRYGGYPFGDRLLSKGIGRDWFEGARAARRSRTA
jgi:hypothetical protein